MSAKNRTVDLLVEAFDLNQRRKFELKNAAGEVIVNLYFKPITRADRKKAQSLSGTEEALDVSTQMLCQMAELEDGTKAFAAGDAPKLQRQLPETVLNDLELFLFGVGEDASMEEAKND
ncbi:putative phage tail assembly chaperone [uncultured Mediterranean phage uvMED]|nr:putative phage tail assembly chaperone [uncultured Mediterranean phage uvMED]